MSSSEEQLISFFAYSMFIYPVTSYLVSPKRSYGRWRGAIYAICFLIAVFMVQLVYENKERGLNHYQLLNVRRHDPGAIVKKAFKRLSLELHPDKNKSPGAVEDFRRVKQAYDVLSNTELRSTYDRLGEHGVKVVSQSVIDYKYILLQLIVYYASSAVFAFLMTISEPSGDAFELSIVGLATMLLIESLLVIEEMPLPKWFFPQSTPYDVISFLHRLFPAFMNGSRSILGAFHEDIKAKREVLLQQLIDGSKATTLRVSSLLQTVLASRLLGKEDGQDQHRGIPPEGIMASALKSAKKLVELSPDIDAVQKLVAEKARLVRDASALKRKDEKHRYRYMWIVYIAGFVAARFLFIKTVKNKA